MSGDTPTTVSTSILGDAKSAASIQRFQEQCFLMAFYEDFTSIRRNSKVQFKNFFSVEGGNPIEFVSKITRNADTKPFFNITHANLAAIVPRIELYKMIYPTEHSTAVPVRFPFPAYTDPLEIEAITNNGEGIANGVGIQNVDVTFAGKNEVESEKNIEVGLQILFNSIEDLQKEHKVNTEASTEAEISFKDLIVPSRKYNNDEKSTYNGKYFRIKADIGWSVSQNFPDDGENIEELRTAVERMALPIFMTMYDFKLNFLQNGKVELNLKYIGSLERALMGPEYDILTTKEYRKQKQQLDREIANLDEDDEGSPSDSPDVKEKKTEEASKEKERLNKIDLEGRSKLYSRLLQYLEDHASIYYLDVPEASMQFLLGWDENGINEQTTSEEMVKQRGSAVRYKGIGKAAIEKGEKGTADLSAIKDAKEAVNEMGNMKDATEASEKASDWANTVATESSNGAYRLNYIFMGDIIDSALGAMFDDDPGEADQNFRMLMGPVAFPDPLNPGEITTCPISDVPVSLNLFMVWFMKQVVQTKRGTYSFGAFLRDIISEFIGAVFKGDCFERDETVTNIKLNTFTLTGTSVHSKVSYNLGGRIRIEELNEIKNKFGTLIDDQYNYLILYADSHSFKNIATEDEDTKNGIYHIKLAQNRGIVKDVQFHRSDIPGIREHRLTATDIDDPTKRLREPYDTTINLVGNTLFFPGQLLYVNPTTIGGGAINTRERFMEDILLGGYYEVVRVDHKLARGKFDTALEAVYVASKDGKVTTMAAKGQGKEVKNEVQQRVEEVKQEESKAREESYGRTGMALKAMR